MKGLPMDSRSCSILLALATAISARVLSRAAQGETYTTAERRHWACQPWSNPPVPFFTSPEDRAWARVLAGSQWDAHQDIEDNHLRMAAKTDKPIAGPLKDLKQGGLLDSTLVVWGGEFGRTPEPQYGKGRDHNNAGFISMWMAGGSVRGGVAAGATDDIGLTTFDRPHQLHDIHTTIPHQLGLSQDSLNCLHQGRNERLTEARAEVIKSIYPENQTRKDA
jgi:uncharacterized protein (DUF1501 family)